VEYFSYIFLNFVTVNTLWQPQKCCALPQYILIINS